jgi:hypothetical protein
MIGVKDAASILPDPDKRRTPTLRRADATKGSSALQVIFHRSALPLAASDKILHLLLKTIDALQSQIKKIQFQR